AGRRRREGPGRGSRREGQGRGSCRRDGPGCRRVRRRGATPDMSAPVAPSRKRPRARLRPEALAAARGGAREGLEWLGRQPEARASLLYRLVRLVARLVLFGLFRFHIRTSGQEHLPKGGYLLVAGAHRGWMDPFVVLHALP